MKILTLVDGLRRGLGAALAAGRGLLLSGCPGQSTTAYAPAAKNCSRNASRLSSTPSPTPTPAS